MTRPATVPQISLARHFHSPEDRPEHLDPLDPEALSPLQRLLLINDGTLLPALEALGGERARIELLDQGGPADAALAAVPLDPPPGEEPVRRRALIHSSVLDPHGCAESALVPSRLPTEFGELAASLPGGIGEALATCGLEHRRELLWFGAGEGPPWAPELAGASLIVRAYRIVVNGEPAAGVVEGFPAAPVPAAR